jgi:hypothetical protein
MAEAAASNASILKYNCPFLEQNQNLIGRIQIPSSIVRTAQFFSNTRIASGAVRIARFWSGQYPPVILTKH